MSEAEAEQLLAAVALRSRTSRDEAILAALDGNVPVAQIADAAGLSRQAVYDIRDANQEEQRP
jgi:hypothetical protein